MNDYIQLAIAIIVFIVLMINQRSLRAMKKRLKHKNALIWTLRNRLGDKQDNSLPDFPYEIDPPKDFIEFAKSLEGLSKTLRDRCEFQELEWFNVNDKLPEQVHNSGRNWNRSEEVLCYGEGQYFIGDLYEDDWMSERHGSFTHVIVERWAYIYRE